MSGTETTTGLQFRLRYADGRSEQMIVDADRALIGSAAHCEVRLPQEAAAPEHVEVFSSERIVHLASRVIESPPLLDGVPVTNSPWGPGHVLTIGGIALTVAPVDLGQKTRGRSPFWLFAPVPPIAIVVSVLLANAYAGGDPIVPDAPPLFDPPITACPTPPGMTQGDQLQAFAAEKMRLALAKRERGPFSRLDAVDAVPLFELAAACYHLAGDTEAEREAAADAALSRKRLEDEYSVRRVQLEHFMRIGDAVGAKRELIVLLPMTSRRTSKYRDWMGWADRIADNQIETINGSKNLHP